MSHRYTLIAIGAVICAYAAIIACILFATCLRPALQAGANIH